MFRQLFELTEYFFNNYSDNDILVFGKLQRNNKTVNYNVEKNKQNLYVCELLLVA